MICEQGTTLGFRIPASALHVVIAVAMALSLFVVRASHSLSHDPVAILAAEKRAHAELAMWAADHGHAHDEGDHSERAPGHVHGHDPSDHSHETPGMIAKLTQDLVRAPGSQYVQAFNCPELGERRRVERPPKCAPVT